MMMIVISTTFRTHDSRATLIFSFFHHAIFANRFDKGANPEVAHEHLVVACAVQARFRGSNLLSFIVMLILIVAA